MNRRVLAMMLVAVMGMSAILLMVFIHPLGYVVSIGIAIGIYVSMAVCLVLIGKPFRTPESEKKLIELEDTCSSFVIPDDYEPPRWVP